jgi:radical SAM protein with 4Fe4S-binding SPASM domain
LLPDQEYVFYENRYLKMVFWSLTGHCNYRCRHCYMSAPHAVYPQPTTEQCLDVVDQIAACGIRRVGVTGGEPLVRRDFLQIVDHMLEKGIQLVTIMTNGALVDEKLLDELAARNCRPEFHMSFDGPEHWHDWLRGVDGAYGSVRRALTRCHERGFTTGCGVVLHKGNVGMLRDIVNELGSLGVSFVKVNRLSCVGEGTTLTDYAITAEEEYDTYLEYLPHYIEDGMPVPILMLSEVFTANQGKFSIGAVRHQEDKDCSSKPICAAARNTMYLGPDGRILPCIPMAEQDSTSEVFPTIADMTLAEALSDSFYMEFISTTLGAYLRHNPECAACAFKNRCGGGCRGHAVVANGGSDLLGIDPSTCLLFKGGYYDRVLEFIERYQGCV